MTSEKDPITLTIVHLRPQTADAIAVLDYPENDKYQIEVSPPPEAVDVSLDTGLDQVGTSTLPPHGVALHDHPLPSREPSPGIYPSCSRVLRLSFESVPKRAARGFEFGDGPGSDVRIPYIGLRPAKAYFRICYNFDSGALLITALDRIRAGSATLAPEQSLLLMLGMTIHCGENQFDFVVEFPDISHCAEKHEEEYNRYASKIGINNAQYLPTPRDNWPTIGTEHRSAGTFAPGGFGVVHKAVNIRDGRAVAIKVLEGYGENEMAEENVIKYERAFMASGHTCIVMELTVNDLHLHLKARKGNKLRSPLSMRAVQSIGRQALSALAYLHSAGVIHRDLKPKNILVMNWDHETDVPIIKLADFGLAGEGSEERQTCCGTFGYIAPEMQELNDLVEEQKERRRKGLKTVPKSRLPKYTKAVDIWALGKILQELLDQISPQSQRRTNPLTINKKPAHRLIDYMMQDHPNDRPTAVECLSDPWIAIGGDRSYTLQAHKRNRSPAVSASNCSPSDEQPLRKVVRRALETSTSKSGVSTRILMDAMWPEQLSSLERGSTEACPSASVCRAELSRSDPAAVEFTLNQAVLNDRPGPQDTPSMQEITRNLLAALQEQGYGNNVTLDGKDTTNIGVVREGVSQLSVLSLRVQRHTEGSMMLGIEFADESGSAHGRNIFSQAMAANDRNSTVATADNWSTLRLSHILFSQAGPPSLQASDTSVSRQDPRLTRTSPHSTGKGSSGRHSKTSKGFTSK